MTLPTVVKTQTLSDAAGLYTAYTYSDGHVQTSPPNRPVSKEDLQRQVRDQLAQANATAALTNDRSRFTKTTAQLAAPNAQQIARAEFDVVAGGLVTAPLSNAINNFSKFSGSATSTESHETQLISTVPLGGSLNDPTAVEYVAPEVIAAAQPTQHENYAVQRLPLQLVRSN